MIKTPERCRTWETSTDHAAQLPTKDVWLYPLRKDFRSVLAV
jgi:hypothetical protein